MRRVRTFIAVDVVEEVVDKVAQVQKRLASTGAKIRLVEPGNMHLTVKFIGDFDEVRLADLCAAAQRAASAVKPFELEFKGIGAFPRPESPRVVFLGCAEEPRGAMSELHDMLEAELEDLGVPREGKRFKPHLTLARVRAPDKTGGLASIIGRFGDFEAGRSLVEELSVFISELTPDGPVYTRAGRASLGK